MPSKQALNPPKGQCTQCWLHAYDSRAQHKHLAPRQDCPACVSHMGGRCPDSMIVKG
ncbi:pRL2-8 [Streptomyces sp. NPDC050392]|uniref:pRL2-8 n=1 Tax=Streptomyces sp. NPDC050392 TaxID=3155782 RepID=UPI00342A10F2